MLAANYNLKKKCPVRASLQKKSSNMFKIINLIFLDRLVAFFLWVIGHHLVMANFTCAAFRRIKINYI
jgi:hypothetical protein